MADIRFKAQVIGISPASSGTDSIVTLQFADAVDGQPLRLVLHNQTLAAGLSIGQNVFLDLVTSTDEATVEGAVTVTPADTLD